MKHHTKKDFINYRISRANETIKEIPFLIKAGYYQTAVNRIYYACFYAAIAILLKNDISAKEFISAVEKLLQEK